MATQDKVLRIGLKGLAFALVYAAVVVLRQHFLPLEAGIIWWRPAAGLAVALFLRWGVRGLLPVALGAALAGVLLHGLGATALALLAAGVLGPAAGTVLLRKRHCYRGRLRRVSEYLWLLLCCGVAGGAVSALVAVGVQWLGGGLAADAVWPALQAWWMAELLGVATIAPPLLLGRAAWRAAWRRAHRQEAGLLLGVALLTGQHVFAGWGSAGGLQQPNGFWLFVFVTWAALRFEREGVVLLSLLLSMQAIGGALLGIGFGAELQGHHPILLWRYLLVLNVSGMAVACYVTQQRTHARRLMARAVTLRDEALEKMQEGVALADAQHRLTYVNPALERLTGYTRAELLGHTMSRLQGADTDARTVQQIRDSLNTRQAFKGEILNYRKDGSRFWNALSVSPIVDAAGDVKEYFGLQSDVSERRAAQEALAASEERMRLVLRASTDGIWDWDLRTWKVTRSDEWFRMLGYEPGEIEADRDRWHGLMHPGDLERIKKEWSSMLAGREERFAMELRLIHKSGRVLNVLSRGYVLRDTDGRALRVCGTNADVTDQKEHEARLKLAAALFKQSREGITVTDAQRNILLVNPAFTAITGYTEDQVRGKNPRVLASGRQDAAFYQAMWAAVNGTGHWEGEIWNRRSDGTVYCEWLSISALHDAKGQVTNYVGSFADLSQAKEAETRIQWLSQFDTLTGLPNASLLRDRVALSLSMVMRAGEPLSLLMLGVDHFKTINDALGHDVGDALLVAVAQRLRSLVREQDTAARLGGKEFVLVLPGAGPQGAAHLARELLGRLALPYELLGHELSITVSIGVAGFPENGADFDSLLKACEIAMHRAQENGRDTFQFFSTTMYEQVLERERIVKALRQAAERQELELVYQPLVDLQSGHISGMEALLRWHPPQWGSVPPARFIPLAEESGLIKPIGQWVLARACRDIRAWRDQGLQVPPVAVNVSAVQFNDRDLVAHVRQSLDSAGLSADALVLEVTEGALMKDVAHSEAMLRELKELGVSLSLDDFGTGYSSLSYLKRFPFDKVKIDQSFVRDITTNQSDVVIVKVIVSMAHGLGLRVIAEGVETEAQCEIMRTQVCDEIQGYFFSRPVRAPALAELLRDAHQLPAHLLRLRKLQRTLLLVDDEANVLSSLKRLFRRDGHQILTAGSGPDGLEVLDKHKVDVIISDQRMPGMTGVEFLRQAKVRFPDTIRIVLSGYTELQSVTDAINEGAVYRFLTKPWDDDQLREQIHKAFEFKELQEENRLLDIRIRSANQELVAANRKLGAVLERTRTQIEQERSLLNVLREALMHLPIAVLGIDDEGTVALVNQAAERLFAGVSLLGESLSEALPDVAQLAAQAAPHEARPIRVHNTPYLLCCSPMGLQSDSQGRIITLQAQVGET